MAREVSVRDLRNHTADVVAAIRNGEEVTLTVNNRPVADIVPHVDRRSPWVSSSELIRIRREAPADPGLLDDLAAIRGEVIEDI